MIGIFDSGIGGLTVLRELAHRFPQESFLYLGDTARLPYGTKSPETIRQYVKQNIIYLRERQVKAIVVACNSASSVLEKYETDGIPIYDVIRPGAGRAVAITTSGKIGVIGTTATVGLKAYPRAIERLNPQIKVFQQACPLLVPLVEEGWLEDPLTNLVIHRYLSKILAHEVDTLILGCTHYPAIKAAIARVCGSSVSLVDSASSIADLIQTDFDCGKLACEPSPKKAREIQILVTDSSPTFTMVAQRLMGDESLLLEHVNIAPASNYTMNV